MKMIFQGYLCFGVLLLSFLDVKFTFFLVSQSYVLVTKGEGNIKWDFFELLKDKC